MKLTTRGWIVLVIIPALLATLLISYFLRDACYIGEGGNFLGYGSCSKLIDQVVNQTDNPDVVETMP